MRYFVFAFALACTTASPGAAQQAPYTPDDVVDFLVDSVDLGLSRGICIGTQDECAQPEPKGLDMLINFELDSADLTDQARENLAIFADALKDDRLQTANFVVEGHTDARGGALYNDELSNARAASVEAYLVELGVSEERLKAIGLGETEPRTDDPLDPENRRVELRIDVQ